MDAGDINVTLKSFELTVLDCLKGLYAASARTNWYSYKGFNLDSYNNDYSLTEECDLNWIIPKKLCALSSPNTIDAFKHAVTVFKREGVKHLIRLNDDTLYDKNAFKKSGVEVHDLVFPDGSSPDLVNTLSIT